MFGAATMLIAAGAVLVQPTAGIHLPGTLRTLLHSRKLKDTPDGETASALEFSPEVYATLEDLQAGLEKLRSQLPEVEGDTTEAPLFELIGHAHLLEASILAFRDAYPEPPPPPPPTPAGDGGDDPFGTAAADAPGGAEPFAGDAAAADASAGDDPVASEPTAADSGENDDDIVEVEPEDGGDTADGDGGEPVVDDEAASAEADDETEDGVDGDATSSEDDIAIDSAPIGDGDDTGDSLPVVEE